MAFTVPLTLDSKIAEGYHGGMDPCFHAVVGNFADRQELDTITELSGKLDIQRGDLGNTLDVDIV